MPRFYDDGGLSVGAREIDTGNASGISMHMPVCRRPQQLHLNRISPVATTTKYTPMGLKCQVAELMSKMNAIHIP